MVYSPILYSPADGGAPAGADCLKAISTRGKSTVIRRSSARLEPSLMSQSRVKRTMPTSEVSHQGVKRGEQNGAVTGQEGWSDQLQEGGELENPNPLA